MDEACIFLFEETILFLLMCEGETKQLSYFPFEKLPSNLFCQHFFNGKRKGVYVSYNFKLQRC